MMKKNLLTNFKTILCFMGMALIVISCKKDIFDKRDLTGVDPMIWDDEASVNLYINKTYDLVIPNWPGGGIHTTSDEKSGGTTAILYGQLTDNSITDIATANKNGNNIYFNIRRINIGIEGIEASPVLSKESKSKLKGQMYFMRAFIYFNMVRLYGGVPLVTKALDINKDSLDVGREKTSVCIKQIVQDLDSCYGLPASWSATFSVDGGRLTREAAKALKGKVLMYWASPQFNPDNDQSRWNDAYLACKEAYTAGVADGFKLVADYKNIFLTEQNNTERIIWRTLDAVSINPSKGTNVEAESRPISETASGSGGYQPSWNMVKAYTLKDGIPITGMGSAYSYNESTFWLNRDPRFQASVSYNGDNWPLSGKANRRQWNYVNSLEEKSKASGTGFYCKRFSIASLSPTQAVYNSNSAGGSGMDWVEMRFAEVILNYAECANAIGNLAEAKDMVRLIRIRAGIIAGTKDYGLALATDRGSMDDLIMNERMVEFSMEGYRYHDLRRTRRFDKLNGTFRQAYRWEVKSPYAVAIPTPPTLPNPAITYVEYAYPSGVTPRDTINFNNPESVNKVFTITTPTIDGTNIINFPENYYFYPLPTAFRTSSIKIEQNIGWPGGTFDPLK